MNETINSCLTPDHQIMAIITFFILMLLAVYGVFCLWSQLDNFFESRRLKRIGQEADRIADEIKDNSPSFSHYTPSFSDSYRHRHIELLSIISSRIYAGKDISMDKAIEAGYDLIKKSECFII